MSVLEFNAIFILMPSRLTLFGFGDTHFYEEKSMDFSSR